MPIQEYLSDEGVLEVVIDLPPVNAIDITSLAALAALFDGLGSRPEVKAVVLRGEGKGFVGGGDVKEVQRLDGFAGILGQANGSVGLTDAVHSCSIPVIAAVHTYCIGLGVLIAGACDIVVADRGCRFVLAEVDNGATGGAIQAIGLMPDKRLRLAMFTCEPVLAEELAGYGTVMTVDEPAHVHPEAVRIARVIAHKQTSVVRAAKRAINGSVGRDISRLYRQELSYTYELNMTGDASAARETFVSGERNGYLSQE
ncbi:enoyl-CoA hydratase/isomerase [Mycobacterium tuberculosis]|nr:enoyl-CoA hydratase/isomerase [Mycobacterium tuberculosis]